MLSAGCYHAEQVVLVGIFDSHADDLARRGSGGDIAQVYGAVDFGGVGLAAAGRANIAVFIGLATSSMITGIVRPTLLASLAVLIASVFAMIRA